MATHLEQHESFVRRHIGPSPEEQARMLSALGVPTLDALVEQTVPSSIRLERPLDLPQGLTEAALLERARELGAKNELFRSYLGMGYSDTITPPVILRNIIQNPGWYTQYTPYQAEIAQGRLEALLNFQTAVIDLTGLPVANASLLDEGTAAAEAMHLANEFKGSDEKKTFFVSEHCHPQTIDVIKTRAEALGINIVVGDHRKVDLAAIKAFGALVQYPTTDGEVCNYASFGDKVHAADAIFVVAADILSLALLVPPGEFGADVAVGSTQRFGVPLGYGGPHAAYFACKNEYVRKLPGRIIGVSEDANKKPALRMALQTREQHIRRERATSNICTAQALLAVVASMYAVYHGPKGIRAIAGAVHGATCALRDGLAKGGVKVAHDAFFDTVRVEGTESEINGWFDAAAAKRINLRRYSATSLTIALDETTSLRHVAELLSVFVPGRKIEDSETIAEGSSNAIPKDLQRSSAYLTHPVFSAHHSETEMLRYMRKLEGRDLSLAHSMIPLGSCTMKLNATAEMMPITEPQWNSIHPFVPLAQAKGYAQLFSELEKALGEVTGFPAISLQPNAGAQGEYAGLLAIKAYHESRGESHRKICLIPSSAHGTNPASAVMAGMEVVVTKTDDKGNIDVADLEEKAKLHAANLSALMVTYPSTHGVFEESIKRICQIVHENGGQVYMDGANMNAQVGLCRPADIGADVCHLNLHKTFCIPHGGGGPGMGPIGVAAHLAKFLPAKPVVEPSGSTPVGPVSAAPWGSASILLISWAYIQMMGGAGLTEATKHAILNANYIAHRLGPHFPIVYQGTKGRVAHECIVDVRQFKKTAGIEVDDVAKRLMDYGFHAPTMSFPIAGTLMIEPTESESLAEIDRFCDAMIAIREEIRAIEESRWSREDNPLKHAPHTIEVCVSNEWTHAYSREVAAFPAAWTRDRKFWPAVGRLNNALGDRKLICACIPIEDYA
ncbi:Glycine dehydrogenase [decarboxylating] (glycine cleavage system P protein) [Labilithrix luteola]|uniref:Glycine dehydrogenase (decarboxylating) n=1 Tax=Labilithrix luteola TaxID=1391654 RepID=A0A0K1PRH2_9BACT|nr:aminomethyl-transferring glycine dehydrogenase [Labilithrix luteola]AKU95976.1 Glycine dehydrogenase [decarboxylating] (glycine cleavage system P protein) [Labilithrix luteola]